MAKARVRSQTEKRLDEVERHESKSCIVLIRNEKGQKTAFVLVLLAQVCNQVLERDRREQHTLSRVNIREGLETSFRGCGFHLF